MENASKALLMAGGVLIAILILGSLVLLFANLQDYQNKTDSSTKQSQIAEFNNQFEPYNKDNLTLMELKSVYNKIISNNTKYTEYKIDSNIIKSPGEYTKTNGKSIYEYYMKKDFKDIQETHKQYKVFKCSEIKYDNKNGGRINVMNFEDITPEGKESCLIYWYI